MQKYQNTILMTNGTPAVGASVQVLNYPSGTPATIYSTLTGTAITNPILTNTAGYFSFYAANGRYSLNVTGTNLMTTQFTDILLEDEVARAGTLAIGAGSSCGVNTTAIVGGTYNEQMQAVNVPANTIGINGQIDIQFSVTCGTSASTKTFYVMMAGIQVGPSFTITTQVTTTGTIRIRNTGSTSSQIVSVLTTDGQSTSSFQTLSLDMTKPQLIVFFGGSNGTGADSITLSGYNVTYYNPPVVPTPAPFVPGHKIFWGVNSHPGYYPAANHLQACQFLGVGILRVDWEGSSFTAGIQGIASQLSGSGIQLCVVNGACSMNSGTNVAYASENAAYTANYNLAYNMASNLIPSGITIFEAGNEMDAATIGATEIRTPVVSVQGTNFGDYISSPAFFPIFRGALNGSTDGIRQAAKDLGVTVYVASNAFTNASIWLSDGLWNGTDPMSGTPGGQPCKWDITNWHTYGNATMLGPNTQYTGGGGAPNFNLLAYLANAYGKPIFITEFNPSNNTASTNASQTTSWMTSWLNVQAQYNIASVMFYDLFDNSSGGTSPYYNLYNNSNGPYNGTNLNATGTAFQSFIASNPAPR